MFTDQIFEEVLSYDLSENSEERKLELQLLAERIRNVLFERVFKEGTSYKDAAKNLKEVQNQWVKAHNKGEYKIVKLFFSDNYILDLLEGICEKDPHGFVDKTFATYRSL